VTDFFVMAGGEGVSLSDTPSVSLDRGEAHVEKASRLGFGHASLYGGDYLLTEIFGIGFHPPMTHTSQALCSLL
jgi:hypothetical protein